MPFNSQRDEFSRAATELLQAVALSTTETPEAEVPETRMLVGYLAGALSPTEAHLIEATVARDAESRRQLTHLISTVEAFKRTPYFQLKRSESENVDGNARTEWLRILDAHVAAITRNLHGFPPTTWPALARMSKDGIGGITAAKTVWRALFSNSVPGTSSEGLLRLGFGYRNGGMVKEQAPFNLDGLGAWGGDQNDGAALCAGQVLPNGDMEIEAGVQSGTRATSLFISYTVNGRTLALAETELVAGRAKVTLEGLGRFMKLPTGPLLVESLSAKTGGWPEQCEIGQIVVDSGPRRVPYLGLPRAKDGQLELTGYFEESELGGKWELSLAVTPNSWQVLRRFDIKGVIERPQVLTAELPGTPIDGPFGGALLLKRLGPAVP